MTMSRQVSPDTPLTPTEQLFTEMSYVRGTLNDILTAIRGIPGGSGGPIVIPPDQIQSVIASKAPGTRDFLNPTVTIPVTVLTRLVSNYKDYGILSNLGTPTSIQDLSKFWEPGVFIGDLLYIYWGSYLYVSTITNNDNHVLSFSTLPLNAQPDKGSMYWIIGPGNGSWFAKIPVVIYNLNPLAAGIFQTTIFDMNDCKRALVKINNTLNQAVTVQLMGNGTADFATAVTMGLPIVVPAGGYASIGVGTNDDWHPYIMATLTIAVPPIPAGILNVTVYSQ